jgi:glycosyltransferase 2 family protein
MKKITAFLIKLTVTVGLLSYLFSKIDWAQFLSDVKDVNIFYIIIAALMAYLGIYVSITKWNLFLKNYGIVISKMKLYSVYSISSFFNNFLPTSIGGDVYRVVNIGKIIENKKKEIISSVILERGFGFLSLFIINFFVASFFINSILNNRNFLLLEALILLAFIGILFLFFYYSLILKIKNIITKKKIPIIDKLHDLMISLVDINSKKTILLGLGYSILFALLVALAMYSVFYAFGLQVDFYYILLVSSITQIVSILPISLNSIGVTESLSVFLFSLIGVPLEISLAVALIGRVSMIITSSFGGLFYFFDNKIKH